MQIETPENRLAKLSDELAHILGTAVWSFAKIEWISYEFLNELSCENLLSIVGSQPFGYRMNVLKKLVGNYEVDEDLKNSALDLINRAVKLSEDRNTIVHNPWQVYIDFDKRDFATEIYKYLNQDHKFDLDDIKNFCKEAEEVANNLKQAFISLTMASARTRR